MDIELLLQEGSVGSVWFFVKLTTIGGLAFYLIFAFVVVRQVRHMTQTLEVGFENAIIVMSWLHLLFAILTLFAAIYLL